MMKKQGNKEMQLFALSHVEPYEEAQLLGVYQSLEDAQEAAQLYAADPDNYFNEEYHSLDVVQLELGAMARSSLGEAVVWSM